MSVRIRLPPRTVARYNPKVTPEEKRAYQLAWIEARRNTWLQEHGPCVDCGSWSQLEVDHVDPTTKSLPPSHIWSRRQKVRDAELAKCVVRCNGCHLKKSIVEQKAKGKPCPSSTAYRNGCRCDGCKRVQRDRARSWRAKKT